MGQPGRPARPRTVDLAFYLYLANATIGVLSALVLLITMNALIDEQAAAAGVNAEALGEVVRGAIIITVVITLLVAALNLLFVFMMRNGRNWARILLTVLSALGLLSSLNSLGDATANPLTLILTIVGIALPLAAVFLMFRPESNRYFQQS
ncbi:hypothetical protein AHOG_02300 [Actinoalloteichus hoggarensis]|uniref:Uncharacterized protein n=2 Tax=Actinoalloteichus hoggarensis TaxID=1470176 RepID=A0A221VX92_9PSEU|nr:hypothetical protein AHOG_02300 [Actinoalloteichus hoggarensis]